MKKLIIITIHGYLCLALFSCISATEKSDFALTRSVAEVTDFADTVYFGWIRDIAIHDGQLFFADNGNNKVLITDLNFKFKGTIGAGGGGPFEFKGLRNVEVENGHVFAYDYSGGKVVQFDEVGVPIGSYKIRPGFSEFAVKNNQIFASSYEVDEAPNWVFDLEEEREMLRFGEIPETYLNLPETHVLMNEKYIVNVFRENSLKAHVYSQKGELLSSVDLANNQYLKVWLESLDISSLLRTSNSQVRRAQILSMDAFLTDRYLYVMPPQMRVNDQNWPAILLSYEIKDGELLNEKMIKLREPDEGNFYAFAVTEDDRWFYGFDPASGSIVKLDLNY